MSFSPNIKKLIDIKAPLLSYDFGGTDTFLSYITKIHGNKGGYYIYSLIGHKEQIKVITPSNFLHHLLISTEDQNRLDSSLFLDCPYTVYNMEGKVLYKVTQHKGIFGNSVLDKILIRESKDVDFYYVQFETYLGTKTNLLIINKFLNFIKNRQLVNSFNTTENEIIKESLDNNYIELIVKQKRNINFITLHFLKSAPSKIFTIEEVLLNSNTIEDTYFSELNSLIKFEPINSGWLVISQGLNNYLSIQQIQGVGLDRVIQVKPYLYYVVINEDINPILLSKTFNLNYNFSSSNSIRINGELVLS